MAIKTLCIITVLAPLLGAIITGLGGRLLSRTAAHSVATSGVAIAFITSCLVAAKIASGQIFNESIYTWLVSGSLLLEVGFLIDPLSATMMVVVTFISLVVHIYTIGYMRDDPGYRRFFSYIALFTFAMLMLVMANNFMQLFFGWEAVGFVSYLLIGFWFNRPSAIAANQKAFLINRVGDLGFLLGIAGVLAVFGSLDYDSIFNQSSRLYGYIIPFMGMDIPAATLICLCLFIGAMGKSAQVPLHAWLPDSMEGPTPISALIHAATMVTAGIFMVARMSPLFEWSDTALSVVLIIGAITALFMGLLGIVQNDIKRVVAYSTLSQLGYMTMALGASAYAAAIFHLVTHAFFKALLFLGAGAVIVALHHEQDMRRMGGLYKTLPLTWLTMLVGGLSLTGLPLTAGFYSKDAIIIALSHSDRIGASFAVFAATAGVFITALYTFRMIFLTFHGPSRVSEQAREHLSENGKIITLPLLILAVPSLTAGITLIEPMLFAGYFGDSIVVHPGNDVLAATAGSYHGIWSFALHAFATPPLYLGLAGALCAWYFVLARPDFGERLKHMASPLYNILQHKYGFDIVYQQFIPYLARVTGNTLWRLGDIKIIDGGLVHGSANLTVRTAAIMQKLQTGMLYHYACFLIVGLLLLGAIVFAQRIG
ncbi:MAG: NADH-quinone oxidoreductase subunit L [Candidatus Porifericomitaceae bacterium WSBS_2022_MAG_OTU9]